MSAGFPTRTQKYEKAATIASPATYLFSQPPVYFHRDPIGFSAPGLFSSPSGYGTLRLPFRLPCAGLSICMTLLFTRSDSSPCSPLLSVCSGSLLWFLVPTLCSGPPCFGSLLRTSPAARPTLRGVASSSVPFVRLSVFPLRTSPSTACGPLPLCPSSPFPALSSRSCFVFSLCGLGFPFPLRPPASATGTPSFRSPEPSAS